MSDSWKEHAEKGWQLLSWEGEAQWFATKEDRTTDLQTAIYGTAITRKRTMGGRLRSLDQLLGTIRNAEALGWNLYLNANPTFYRPGKKKLAREDVKSWRYITVDLDPGAEALAPPDTANWNSRLPDEHLSNAHRIFSGRGYQYWLPLAHTPMIWGTEPGLFITDPSVLAADAERIMQGYLRALKSCSDQWAPGWIVDTTCSDLARVVRCPGSVNQKTGRRSTVEFVSDSKGLDITALMCYNTPVELPPITPQLMADADDWTLMRTLPFLNITARKFILNGHGSPGRHTACFATCKNLQELGVPRDRAFEWLLIGAGRCWGERHCSKPTDTQSLCSTWIERFPYPLHPNEVESRVNQVYGR